MRDAFLLHSVLCITIVNRLMPHYKRVGMQMTKKLPMQVEVIGARVHNLKNIDLNIPPRILK